MDIQSIMNIQNDVKNLKESIFTKSQLKFLNCLITRPLYIDIDSKNIHNDENTKNYK